MSICRRTALGWLAAGLLVGALPATAAERAPFDAKAFQAAQEQGRPILVYVSAPWCPTCAAQKPILANLAARPEFRELSIFDVDFDTQKDLLRTFNVRMQSTFVVFKGRTEVARSVGETRPAMIESVIKKAI